MSSVNTTQWPLYHVIDAGASVNSGCGVERVMAPRDKVQHHIPELKYDFQTANLRSLLFLNTINFIVFRNNTIKLKRQTRSLCVKITSLKMSGLHISSE